MTPAGAVVAIGMFRPLIALRGVPSRQLLGVRNLRVGLHPHLAALYSPLGRNLYSQRGVRQCRPSHSAAADNDVVRDPRPARGQALDHVRAGAADAEGAGTTSGRAKQALRGAEEAGRPRPRRARRKWSANARGRSLDHAEGPASHGGMGANARSGTGPRVRGAHKGLLRRGPLEGRPSRHDCPRREWADDRFKRAPGRPCIPRRRGTVPERLPWLVLTGQFLE